MKKRKRLLIGAAALVAIAGPVWAVMAQDGTSEPAPAGDVSATPGGIDTTGMSDYARAVIERWPDGYFEGDLFCHETPPDIGASIVCEALEGSTASGPAQVWVGMTEVTVPQARGIEWSFGSAVCGHVGTEFRFAGGTRLCLIAEDRSARIENANPIDNELRDAILRQLPDYSPEPED